MSGCTRTRADVRDALSGRARFYEVPFSLAETAGIVRGTIDCLVQKDDGLLVLELKTGRARSIHQRQLDLYVERRASFTGTKFPSQAYSSISKLVALWASPSEPVSP